MKIPGSITAGDSLTWEDDPTTDNLGNTIDSSSWTLKYAFQQSGVANLIVTATADGSGWTTSLTKTQTAAWAAGVKVYWQAYVESGSNRITLGMGSLDVDPNISTATDASELRSQAQQDLDAVEAAIRAMVAGGAVAEYAIGGRSMRKMAMADLLEWRSKLKVIVAREKQADAIANGLGNPRNMYVRFGSRG